MPTMQERARAEGHTVQRSVTRPLSTPFTHNFFLFYAPTFNDPPPLSQCSARARALASGIVHEVILSQVEA